MKQSRNEKGGGAVGCTRINCPMQAGTQTERCADNCPWRTEPKSGDLISRTAAIEYLMTNMSWHDEDGYEVDDADEKRAIITGLINGVPAVCAAPVRSRKQNDDQDWRGAQGNGGERIREQAARSEWGIYG